MLHLALKTLRARIPALLAVAIAALGGTALLTGVGVIAETGLRSHAPVERLHHADVIVSADQTYQLPGDALDNLLAPTLPEPRAVPAEVLERLGALDGVAQVVPDISFPAAVVGPDGAVAASAGHGWASLALLDGAGDVPATPGPDDVVLGDALASGAGIAAGDQVTVVLAGERSELHVAAVVPGDGVWVDDPTATRLAGTGDGARLVGVVAEPGRAADVARAAEQALADDAVVVTTGAARGDVESPTTAEARGLLPLLAGSLAGVTLLVVGLVVGGTLGVAVQTQRRELALLRAVGATPRQVRRLAAVQAGLVAAAATVVGAPLGYLLAGRLRELLVGTGMLPEAIRLVVGPVPAVVGIALVLGVVHLAATLASRRVSRLPATEAVAESQTEPRQPSAARGIVGALLILAGTVAAVGPMLVRSDLGAAGTATSGLVIAIGLAVAGPRLVSVLTDLAGRLLPARASAPTWLAVQNSRAASLRVGSAVATLALVVVFTLTYALTHTTIAQATADDVEAGSVADLTVAAPALGGVPDDVAAKAAGLPGVAAAVPMGSTGVLLSTTMLGDTEVEAVGVTVLSGPVAEVLDLGVVEGSLAAFDGDVVALDQAAARAQGVGAGDRMDVVLGDGTQASAEVVALYDRGLGFGPMVVSADLVDGHTASVLAEQVLVRTDGSAQAAAGVAGVLAEVPGVVVGSADEGEAGVPPELWLNIAVLTVVLVYLLLGASNSLVAATMRRRSELSTLRLAGATPRQVRQVVRREAGMVWLIAVGAGTALSVIPLAMLGQAFLDRPMAAGPWWLLPALAAVVGAVAFGSVEFATRRSVRGPAAPGARVG